MFRPTAFMFAIMAAIVAGTAFAEMSSGPVHECFSQTQLKRLLRTKIETIEEMASSQTIIDAVRKQNRSSLSPAKIKQIDAEWIQTNDHTPFKTSLQENTVGKYFQSLINFNESIYNEAFLTDRRGANIAAYPATTDFWQGDEEKWIASFNDGSGDVYVGNIEFDESTQTIAIQISVPVMDEGEAIGVLIVGVKLTYIQAKYLKLKENPPP